MTDKTVTGSETATYLANMDSLDFEGWNRADWHGKFAEYHTADVKVAMSGTPDTSGLDAHIDWAKLFVEQTGGTPIQIVDHPIAFGSGEWTCVVGLLEDGRRMVTVAKWRDGAISEEYIWV